MNGLLFCLLLFLVFSCSSPQKPHAEGPDTATTAPVDRSLLISQAGKFLDHEAKIQPGESVLLISDRSSDEMVRSAFFEAVKSDGATLSQIILEGHPEITDGLEISRRMRFQVWYPQWIWKAASEVDVVLTMTSLGGSHMRTRPELPNTRVIGIPFGRREQLADPLSRGNYPKAVVAAINEVLWKQIWGAEQFQLTTAEGTDLKWTLDPGAWEELQNFDPSSGNSHVTIPPPYLSKTPNMEGWIVGSSTHSGPLPRLRLRVQEGRVVEIEDGQHVAEYLRQMFSKSEGIQFPGFPGPGSNWIEETALGSLPKVHRPPEAAELGWWAQMATWNGAHRSGAFHLAIGTSRSGRNRDFARQQDLEIQHLDIEFYSPTLIMDGQTVVSNGHLTALDDPAVRDVASRYGDPDELLLETPLSEGH